jgi:hypothetical protein
MNFIKSVGWCVPRLFISSFYSTLKEENVIFVNKSILFVLQNINKITHVANKNKITYIVSNNTIID